MKKLFFLLIVITQLLFIACNDKILSPLDSIQISEHKLQGYFVTSIAFDRRGTAWLGTFEQGLIKYDRTITQYNSENSSLPDSLLIWDIAIDKNDNVWIGSNKGLIKYDKSDFHIYDTSNAPLFTNNVSSLAVDAENNLWFTSCVFQVGGLIKYDNTNWTLYTPQNSQLPASLINDIIVDNKNNKWIAVNEAINSCCIVKISGDNWTLFDDEEIGFAPYCLWRLTSSFKNDIYVSVFYGFSSAFDINRPNIISYNGKKWNINNPVNEKGKSLGYVGEIALDLTGNLWAETSENGIAVFDGHKWFYNKAELLIESGVFDIEVAKNNEVWIGSGDGIYIINYN